MKEYTKKAQKNYRDTLKQKGKTIVHWIVTVTEKEYLLKCLEEYRQKNS